MSGVLQQMKDTFLVTVLEQPIQTICSSEFYVNGSRC